MGSVSVIGLGYIGIPIALLLAKNNIKVFGFDIDASIVEQLNSGKMHLAEAELETLLTEVISTGYFTAATKLVASDIYVIAVPTPIDANNKPNMDFVWAAVSGLTKHLKANDLIILESTSPVGTIDKITKIINASRQDLTVVDEQGTGDIMLAYCPERVLPGNTIYELTNNSRIVGGISARCNQASAELYRTFVKAEIVATTAKMAEMVKLTENSYRDVALAFANELSMIASDLKVEPRQLIELANLHPRVNILQPSTGVGGHCISVDPWFLISDSNTQAPLLTTARQVNNAKPQWVIRQVQGFNKPPFNNSVLFMGLSFKPDIDDYRESPALQVVTELQNCFANCSVLEPNLKKLPDSIDNCNRVDLSVDLSKYSLIVVLVAHSSFKKFIQPLQLRPTTMLDFCGLTYAKRSK